MKIHQNERDLSILTVFIDVKSSLQNTENKANFKAQLTTETRPKASRFWDFAP